MGIITVLLYSTGYLHGDFEVPHWVAISCYIAIGLGTMMGGWRIIETMGSRITKLSQHQGFSASMGGSIVLFSASLLGIPVSTTHTITGCGDRRRGRAARVGGPLGRCAQRRHGVGDHHPRLGRGRRLLLLADDLLLGSHGRAGLAAGGGRSISGLENRRGGAC